MTYATANATGNNQNVHATLIIDGVPLLFGTRAGLVLSTSGVFVTGSPSSLTSVDAIVEDSISLEGSTINYDMMMVPPAAGALSIRLSSTWDKYFERRRSSTFITAEITDADTAVTVQNSGIFTAAAPAYVDRETVLINTIASSTSISSITRNYCALPGTKAARHSTLAVLSTVPRYLKGRHAVLHLWNSDTTNTLFRRMRIDSVKYNPKSVSWDLTFTDVMTMLDRPLAVGVRSGKVFSSSVDSGGDIHITTGLLSYSNPQFASTPGLESSVLLTSDDTGDSVIAPIKSRPATDEVELHFTPASTIIGNANADNIFGTLSNGQRYYSPGQISSVRGLSIRRCYVFEGAPMVALLQVLLSDRGDGNNDATYDKLFGITSTSTGSTRALASFDEGGEIRFGAAIPAALLNLDSSDTTALNHADNLADVPDGWRYVLGAGSEEQNTLGMIEEVGWARGGFFFLNSSGKISFKKLSATGGFTTPVAALTTANILRMSPLDAVDDETEIVHTIKLMCNWDPVNGKFMTTVNVNHPMTAEIYREVGQEMKLERKGLVVGDGSDSIGLIAERLYRAYARRQHGIRKYKIQLPWQYHTLIPGDVVSVTHEALNAFNGSTLSAVYFEVAGVPSLNIGGGEGTIEIEVHETTTVKPISPTARVASYSDGGGAGPFVFTLTTSDKYTGDTTPGDFFAAGWKIRLLDKSASPPFSTASAVLTIASKTSTTITTTAAPGFTPAAGDILVQARFDDADNTTNNTEQTLAQRGYAFMSDSDFRLGTSNTAADTWG